MLNDLSWPVRLLVAGFGLAVGLILAGPVAGASSGPALLLLVVGVVLEMLVMVGFLVRVSRAESRFRDLVVSATAEVANGAVVPEQVVARSVRRREVPLPWWTPGRGGGPGPSGLTVFTALVAEGPRRVAGLVPSDLGLVARDVPAVLLVHPVHRDVAVLDDRVDRARLEAVAADPRWGSERLPTDRTVVGGYVALLAALVVGAGTGVGLGALVATLAT